VKTRSPADQEISALRDEYIHLQEQIIALLREGKIDKKLWERSQQIFERISSYLTVVHKDNPPPT
jgi:hypothetical protein